MGLPESFMMKSPSPSAEEIADRLHFLSLVEGMDLPKQRVLNHDYHWILRNAGIRNWAHPRFGELIDFIRKKIG